MIQLQWRVNKLTAPQRVFVREFKGFTKGMAEQGAEMVKRGIYSQRFKHAPLSRRYKKWKKIQGLDPRILIATGKYVESIRARKLMGKEGETEHWLVAPGPGSHDGVSLTQIGLMLEFGTKRMPARPHFRPVAQQLRGTIVGKAKMKLAKIAKAFGLGPFATGKTKVRR